MKTFQEMVTVRSAPELVWRTVIKNLQVTLPTFYHDIVSVEFMDGAPLSPDGVFRVCYHQEFRRCNVSYLKFKWKSIDHTSRTSKATAIEGELLDESIQGLSFSYTVTPIDGDAASCTVVLEVEYQEIWEQQGIHKILKDQVAKFMKSLEGCVEKIKKYA
ncbi:hypothetical protein KP509_20G022200 [Ceratopteris richardii]|uniref:Uncharacterized protein n=1 Tax=Ceratopteris richardii TaxID=49495 RepID=A0A8T2SDS1_CERRI|nr:hypothetical protein KP509_20G022200 [Ceratopteris richardii]